MNGFTSLKIEHSYISYGPNSIVNGLLLPALKMTKIYKRSVGFFSSSALVSLSTGIMDLVNNNGHIYIIASPKLSREDILVITESYEKKKEHIQMKVIEQFKESLDGIEIDQRVLLSNLILADILEIKIVTTKNTGMYHDKLGILADIYNNKIVFVGSSNESMSGLEDNYEKIRVFTSWNQHTEEYVQDEEAEFDLIWNAKNEFVETYELLDAIKTVAFEIVEEYDGRKKGYKLRDYQKTAISNWKNNGYNGFYVMATGTGKTLTALFSAKELLKEHNVVVVIAVPYKHLVTQWYEDTSVIFNDYTIIKVASEFANWENDLINELITLKYGDSKGIIVITTIASFVLNRFVQTISKYNGEKLLIVDEAHRFYNKIANNDYNDYQYKLGLSATPVFGKNVEKAKGLLKFFGGKVFELPIQEAIGKYLVNYKYTPITIGISKQDEEKFKKITQQMKYCFDKDGKMIEPEKYVELHRARLRILSMTETKRAALVDLLQSKNFGDHFIVYCGDGKVYGTQAQELRHLDDIKILLNKYNYRPSQFTASESMNEREILIDLFNKGDISSLVAIKCLDEGINIPSIETAIILSSNDDYREFVQRRGRILRQYKNKKYAEIIDFVIIPSIDSIDIAKIELRRFYEYARLAINHDDLKNDLVKYLNKYNIGFADIDFDDILSEIDGGDLDE